MGPVSAPHGELGSYILTISTPGDVIPEPSTLALLGTALAIAAARRHRAKLA